MNSRTARSLGQIRFHFGRGRIVILASIVALSGVPAAWPQNSPEPAATSESPRNIRPDRVQAMMRQAQASPSVRVYSAAEAGPPAAEQLAQNQTDQPAPAAGAAAAPAPAPAENANTAQEAPAAQEPAQPPTPSAPPPVVQPSAQQPARPLPVPGPRTTTLQPPPMMNSGQQPSPMQGITVNGAKIKSGEKVTQPVNIDFDNTDLPLVVQSLSTLLGKNFDIDPTAATQKVTIISHQPIAPEMVYYILESILAVRGFQMVPNVEGNIIAIRPAGDSNEKFPMYSGKNQMPKGYDNFSTHIVKVEHANATELAPVLKLLGSSKGNADAYGQTNTLILTDNAAGIRKMLEFLKEVDIPGFDDVVEMFTLEYTRAEVIADQIQQVLMGGESGQPNAQPGAPNPVVRQPAQMPRPPARGVVPGQRNPTIVAAQPMTLRIVPDTRLNALVIVASQPLMSQVRDLIEKLDTPTPIENNTVHYRQLLYADAEGIEKVLASMTGGSGSSGSSGSSSPSPRPQSSMTGGGTSTSSSNQSSGPISATLGGGNKGAGDVSPFEKSVTITRYDETNSLLIIASPQDYKVIDSVIEKMDQPIRQVHVEAIIMEVGITDRYRLAVESAGLTANDYFALNNVVSLANTLTQGPLSLTGGQDSQLFNLGIIHGTADIRTTDSTGVTTTQTVPNVPFLMTALEALTALDVLSRPSLTTIDNNQAKITVGQKIPVIRGSQRALDSNIGSSGSVFNSVEQQDVGIKLTVTPQISEGDYVNMELDIEVSSTIPSDIGLDPNLVGPTLSLSQVTDKVVIQDGSTGIVGGLISETTDRSSRQTPLLGDVPGLGWLFRRKDNARRKRNLVVLVTPHIVKEGRDFQNLTDDQLEKAKNANLDVFFDKNGPIKKIEKKHYLQEKYRPTMDAIDEIKKNQGFQRGDVKDQEVSAYPQTPDNKAAPANDSGEKR